MSHTKSSKSLGNLGNGRRIWSAREKYSLQSQISVGDLVQTLH
jgi:hypothetical protein